MKFPDARTQTRGTLASNAKLQYQIAPALQNARRCQRCAVSCTVNSKSTANHHRRDDAPANPRGIPKAPFIERVEDYVTDRSEVETTINSFKEMISYARCP